MVLGVMCSYRLGRKSIIILQNYPKFLIKEHKMAWVQIRLNSTDKQAEQISDFLTEIGAVSVTFMDS